MKKRNSGKSYLASIGGATTWLVKGEMGAGPAGGDSGGVFLTFDGTGLH